MPPPYDAAEQGGVAALQPDRHRSGPPQRRAGARIDEGPAAGRQHHRRAGYEARYHPPLAVSEMRLAVAGEDLGDGQAGRGLDLRVGVKERHAEPRR